MIKYSFARRHFSPKSVRNDTGWKVGTIPPRYSPYEISKPLSSGWEWRTVVLDGPDGAEYLLLFQINKGRDKWKSMLILKAPGGEKTALLRYEDQPGKHGGGLHCHAHCDQLGDLTGPHSVNMCYTLPDHGRKRRRRGLWTPANFVNKAAHFFGVAHDIDQGELL